MLWEVLDIPSTILHDACFDCCRVQYLTVSCQRTLPSVPAIQATYLGAVRYYYYCDKYATEPILEPTTPLHLITYYKSLIRNVD